MTFTTCWFERLCVTRVIVAPSVCGRGCDSLGLTLSPQDTADPPDTYARSAGQIPLPTQPRRILFADFVGRSPTLEIHCAPLFKFDTLKRRSFAYVRIKNDYFLQTARTHVFCSVSSETRVSWSLEIHQHRSMRRCKTPGLGQYGDIIESNLKQRIDVIQISSFSACAHIQ